MADPANFSRANAVPLPRIIRAVLLVYDGIWRLLVAGWVLWHGIRPPTRADGTRAVRERLGYLPPRPRGAPVGLWFHAVSIGEVLSTLPVLHLLKQQHPDWWVLLSTTQRHAYALARSQETGADAVCLLPWDCQPCIERALDRVRPDLLILVECELWPTLIARCARRAVGVLVMNARIYERDLPGYLLARALFAPLLGLVGGVAAQSEADRDRFLRLGMPASKVVVTGSTKFDVSWPADLPARLAEFRARLPSRGGPLWVLASTHADEEEQILRRCGPLWQRSPGLQLLIAPRHIHRSKSLQSLAERLGMRTTLWSQLAPAKGQDGPAGTAPHVILLDTIGELRTALGLADLVFVGGSLVNQGGHNPIEAALHAKPILMGPFVANFAEIVTTFRTAGALVAVQDADALMEQVGELLEDGDRRQVLGRRAAAVIRRHAGVAAANVRLLESAARRQHSDLPEIGMSA